MTEVMIAIGYYKSITGVNVMTVLGDSESTRPDKQVYTVDTTPDRNGNSSPKVLEVTSIMT